MTAQERDPDARVVLENAVVRRAVRMQELERIEAQARRVEKVYEGLRTDASDGTFALWTEDDLVRELHRLGDVLRESA